VYFDEDKISADLRQRSYPWFKPAAFSPDLMLSTNVLMHSVIRGSLVNELGGFDSSVDGAQDWDLSLRIIEKTQHFIHIPRVFYHWRQVPGSAASDANAKPWAFPAQQRCVENHLARLGVKGARVEFKGLGTIHVVWPQSAGKVSIIIPTRDKADLLRACLDSIFEKTAYPDFEVILVDNGSQEPETLAYYQSLQEEPRLRLLHFDAPFNFHTINNFGARQAKGEILVFLNNDTQVLESGWLQELAGWAQRPEVGAVGAKLIRPDGSIQHAGIIIGLGGHGSHVFDGGRENLYGPYGSTEWYRDYQAVTGACLAMRRAVFDELGCFDELYQVGYGDIDLCLRAADAGYRVIYTPFARLLHHEGGSRGFAQPPSDVLRASMRMYARVKAGDPYFNPNLSDWQRLPAIRQPQEKPREWILLKILYDYDLVGREDVGAEAEQRWQIPYPGLPDANPPAPQKTAGKRLLFVSHELSRTGAPISLNRVALHLQSHGYTITVLSPFEGPLRQVYEEAGMRVRVLPSLLEDARIILEELKEHDLLLANTILAFRTIHAARAFDKPVVWWVHESTFGQKWAFSSPCVAQAFQQANQVAFPAQAMAELYRSFSTRDNFNAIHTGFDLDTNVRPDCETGLNLEPDKFTIIAVASIERRKGQDVLIRAIESLPANVRDQVTCLFIGRILSKSEPAYCRSIQRAARRLGNVHILGDLPVEQVHCYLQKMDLFVLASRDEALPLSLVEAMAFGKAIITTDVGGNREIVQDGIHGLLVPKEDPQQLAQAILKLYHDRNLGQRMGKQARESYWANLTFQHMGDGLKELVQLTLQKRT
jgi:glycosyltransferase involved in cell wall biosynthesis/GT2 family glycosyltransferase